MKRLLLPIFLLLCCISTRGATFPYITFTANTNRLSYSNGALTWPTNATIAGVASAGGGVIIGASTNGGWKPVAVTPDVEGGFVYPFESVSAFGLPMVSIAQNYLTNLWGDVSSVVMVGNQFYGPTATDLATANVDIFTAGDYNFTSVLTATNNIGLFAVGDDNFDTADLVGNVDLFALGIGNFQSCSLTGSHQVVAIGFACGTGLSGSYTNIYLIGNGASPTITSDQIVLKASSILVDGKVIGNILPVYNVKLYGAVGNGTTDDTAAIQSAIDAADAANGGTVYFPNGTYKITGITVGTTNGQHYINLVGETQINSVLSYTGPTNGYAVTFINEYYPFASKFTVNNGVARSGTVGILLTGRNAGSQSFGGYVNQVTVSGFHVGIDSGPETPYSGTSSEWVFDSIRLNSCDQGFANFDFNGLNFMFRELQADSTTIVVKGLTAGITIDGGSFSNCGTGFYCRNGGLFSIKNVRSETETGPFVDSSSTVVVENCLVNVSNTNNPSISLSGGNATIKMCQLGSYIGATNTWGLDIEDTGIWATTVATTTNPGYITYLRNYQTVGQTSARQGAFADQMIFCGMSANTLAGFGSTTNLQSVSVGVGITNVASNLSLSIAAGANISFTTNSNGQVTIAAGGSGGGGNVQNTGTPSATAIPKYSDTTGTNIAPSGVLIASGDAVQVPTTGTLGFSTDVILVRDTANRIAMRNGTTAQGARMYNTYSNSGTNEFATLGWDDSANTYVIRTEKTGTGSIRNLFLGSGGNSANGGSVTIFGSGNGVILGKTGALLSVGATSGNGWNIDGNSPFGILPGTDATSPLGSKVQRALDVWNAGAVSGGIFTTATNYTAGAHDYTILANGTTLTITLPTAVGVTGQEYVVKVIANSTATVATTSSQNIDASTTYSLSAQNKYVRVQSDGVQWRIVGNN